VAAANGLPPDRFSSKSLRGGFASQCERTGVATELRNERGTWAVGSRIPDQHYVSEVGSRGVMARGTEGSISVDELRRMANASGARGGQ
jgi:hypothetical protein